MGIIVSGITAVPDILKSRKIDAVLSIEHPNAQEGAGRVLRLENVPQEILCFWDIEKENFPDGPSDEIMQEAFAFLEVHKSQDVLIHCKAGKSRSVAIALAWEAHQTDIDSAVQFVKNHCEFPAPNLAMIQIADRLFGFDGKFVDTVENDDIFTINREDANQRRIEHLAKYSPEKLPPQPI